MKRIYLALITLFLLTALVLAPATAAQPQMTNENKLPKGFTALIPPGTQLTGQSFYCDTTMAGVNFFAEKS